LPKRAAGSFPSYLYKSLDELEGIWGEPDYPSNLVIDCHALHRKPLFILSDIEVDLALGQRIGLPWLRTLVLLRLRQEPLRAGEYSEPAELLRTALSLSPEEWGDLATDLRELAAAVVPTLPETSEWFGVIAEYDRFTATR
jgi:hypothetical protein